MNSIDEKNIAEIKEYFHSLEKLNPTNYQKNRLLILSCFGKCIEIIEKNAALREEKERYPYTAEEIRPHQEDYNKA